MRVHAVIFCWPGQVENARGIYRDLSGHVEKLTVIDSSGEAAGKGIDGWREIDTRAYYGHQFREALDCFEGDVLLQIQADAASDDWQRLIALCKARHKNIGRLGIWSPEIDYTHWSTPLVKLYDLPGTGLVGVGQTDCIVWSLRKDIVAFLKTLNYDDNNFGWGIDWAAIAFAMVNGMLVLRDTTVSVVHPKGSGYAHRDAKLGMAAFRRRLPIEVGIQNRLLLRAFAPEDL